MYSKTVQKSQFLEGRKDQGSSPKCTIVCFTSLTKMHKSGKSQQYKFLSKSKYIYVIIKGWFANIFALICYFCHFRYFRCFCDFCCICEASLLHLPPKNWYFCDNLLFLSFSQFPSSDCSYICGIFLQSAGSRSSSGCISGSRYICWTNSSCSMLFKGHIFGACHDTVTSFSWRQCAKYSPRHCVPCQGILSQLRERNQGMGGNL